MKALIFDLDDTLLRSDKTISGYTAGVLQKCREKGIRIMIATARPERVAEKYRTLIHSNAAAIMNGAKILLPGRAIENGIPHTSVRQILSKLIEIPGTMVSIETAEGLFSNVDIPEWNTIFYPNFPNLPTDGIIYKILASGQKSVLFGQADGILTEDTYYTIANNELVQIMSKTATKWNGIKAMLEFFGIPQSDSYYFGDDYVDIEPIQKCGVGVAVLNAIKEVRDAADFVTDSNDEDGPARFIEKNLL